MTGPLANYAFHMGLDPVIICFGLGVGVLIGLTGVGGGSFMTLLLLMLLFGGYKSFGGHRNRSRV